MFSTLSPFLFLVRFLQNLIKEHTRNLDPINLQKTDGIRVFKVRIRFGKKTLIHPDPKHCQIVEHFYKKC